MAHIRPTEASSLALVRREISGPVHMLNLLRFAETADYSATPQLAPDEPISGVDAYRRYTIAVTPLLTEVGGEVVFDGSGGSLLVGPPDEWWDRVLLMRYPDVATFLSFVADESYLAVVGHRTAALEDARLLPITGGTPGSALRPG